MRSEAMQRLDALVGRWRASMHEAWFLPEPDVENAGIVVVDWWSDAFVTFHWHADGADLQVVRAALFDALVAADVPPVDNTLPQETTPPPAGSVLNPSAIWAARSATTPATNRRIAP